MAIHKCMFCKAKFDNKPSLYNHIDKKHKDLVPEEVTIPQMCFNFRNKKTSGKCVICGAETEWNDRSERYNTFCTDRCKEIYVKEAKARMVKKYGKEHILDSATHQKKMLQNRSISGKYKWSSAPTEIPYTGSYELEFLEFLDKFLDWDSRDIMECPFSIDYEHDGVKRFYIPDFYIPSLNLIIEIKDGGDNPNMHHKIQDVDKVKENLKDKAIMEMKKYNYIKITNKEHSRFIEFLTKLKDKEYRENINMSGFKPLFMLGESIGVTVNNLIESIMHESEDI